MLKILFELRKQKRKEKHENRKRGIKYRVQELSFELMSFLRALLYLLKDWLEL